MADASDYKEYLRNNKDNCSWSMEADLGKIIEVTFKTVDIKDKNSKCENYWFQAYDGPNPNSTKLGRRVCNDLIRSKKAKACTFDIFSIINNFSFIFSSSIKIKVL